MLETPWDPQVLDLVQSDDPNWFEHADAPPPLLNPDFDAHGNYRQRIAQSATTLTTDDKPLIIMETITPPTGHLLWRKPLMALLHLLSYRLTCTGLSMQVLEPPWAPILFPLTCYLLTMDHIWWFQPHGIMTCYAPCLPGFLMTLLGKPLMSRLSMPTFLTTLFSMSILNCQIWP
jgi:hypothetical protein